jgi:hypothetical protein
MAKFKLQPGERVLKKAAVNYVPPEGRDKGFLKTAMNLRQCTAFLTTARLAACSRIGGFPTGPLIWLIQWLVGRDIVIEVPLNNIKRVEIPDSNGRIEIKTTDGTDYLLLMDSLFDSREHWMEVLDDAITKAGPDARIQSRTDYLEVRRGMGP